MNFFWEESGWEANDPHLSKVRAMPFQRRWPFIPREPGLYIVRGPRQVGKTSWLKAVLAAFAADQPCFYLSCEEVTSFKELGEILRSVRSRALIVLDEVTFVRGWDRAIKHFVDGGYPGVLCVTGSHAGDIEAGVDLMPGRFGGGGEFVLLPMTFREFRAARHQAGWDTGSHVSELRRYFHVGGMPTAVAAAGASGDVPAHVRSTYWRWLRGDAINADKDPQKLAEVLIQVVRTALNPVSLQSLARKTQIGSVHTISSYLRLLEASFALRTLFAIDPDTGSFRYRSNRKLYVTDPLIFAIGCHLSGDALPDDWDHLLAETVVHEHLARLTDRFGFHRGRSGEVDFLCPKSWAIEVKWAPVARNLSKAYLDLPLADKAVWTQESLLLDWPSSLQQRADALHSSAAAPALAVDPTPL